MAASATIVGKEVRPDGHIVIKFAGGVSYEYPNLEEMKAAVSDFETFDAAAKLAIGRALTVGNELKNTAAYVNKMITVDMTAQSPITVK